MFIYLMMMEMKHLKGLLI